MSERALADVLRRVAAGTSTHATIPPRQSAASEEPELVDELLAAVPPVLSATWHRDGVSARRRAWESLAEVTGRFDELLAGIEQVEARVARVMQAADVGVTSIEVGVASIEVVEG